MRNIICFECEKGFYKTHILPYKTTDTRNEDMIILDIPHYVCNNCGNTRLSTEASRVIKQSIILSGEKYIN